MTSRPQTSRAGTGHSVGSGSSDAAGSEIGIALDRAKHFVQGVEASLAQAQIAVRRLGALEQRANDLNTRLEEAEADRRILTDRLVEAERQTGRLMTLYVATYQLHATLNPEEVQSTIVDIALNLIGAEQFVLLMREEGGAACEVALAEGNLARGNPLFASGRYNGGDPLLDATLVDGVLRFGPTEESSFMAIVPLRVQDITVGSLVVLKLLDHKASFQPDDRELLDLMAAHAASALFASRVYSVTARKLQTLESLMKLVKRG